MQGCLLYCISCLFVSAAIYDRHAMAAYHDKEPGAIVGHLPHEIPLLDEPGDMTRLLDNTA